MPAKASPRIVKTWTTHDRNLCADDCTLLRVAEPRKLLESILTLLDPAPLLFFFFLGGPPDQVCTAGAVSGSRAAGTYDLPLQPTAPLETTWNLTVACATSQPPEQRQLAQLSFPILLHLSRLVCLTRQFERIPLPPAASSLLRDTKPSTIFFLPASAERRRRRFASPHRRIAYRRIAHRLASTSASPPLLRPATSSDAVRDSLSQTRNLPLRLLGLGFSTLRVPSRLAHVGQP
ncbi:hypothetical protein V8C37DRAFT_416245 [Trichoderma ceciliae]